MKSDVLKALAGQADLLREISDDLAAVVEKATQLRAVQATLANRLGTVRQLATSSDADDAAKQFCAALAHFQSLTKQQGDYLVELAMAATFHARDQRDRCEDVMGKVAHAAGEMN